MFNVSPSESTSTNLMRLPRKFDFAVRTSARHPVKWLHPQAVVEAAHSSSDSRDRNVTRRRSIDSSYSDVERCPVSQSPQSAREFHVPLFIGLQVDKGRACR